MIKAGRITFIIGSIAFIVIGLLHSYVHFYELSGEALRMRFENIGRVDLQGDTVSPWDLFQGVSLLMGFFSIAFGAALLGLLMDCAKDNVPHALVSISAILLLVSIAVVGAMYLSAFQVIGGIAGIACFGTTLVARQRGFSKS